MRLPLLAVLCVVVAVHADVEAEFASFREIVAKRLDVLEAKLANGSLFVFVRLPVVA